MTYWFVTYREDRAGGFAPLIESQVQREHPLITAAKFASEQGSRQRVVFYAPISEEEIGSSPEMREYFRYAIEENCGELGVPPEVTE